MQVQQRVPSFPMDGLGPKGLTGAAAHDYMQSVTKLRTPEMNAAIEHMAHGSSQGVWRQYALEFSAERGAVRGAFTRAALESNMGAAFLTAHAAKLFSRSPRPYQLDTTLHVVGQMPHSSSYPSAHSTVAAAAADSLARRWGSRSEELQRMATAVQQSRVLAAAHFPKDVQAGATLGHAVATGTHVAGVLGVVAATVAGAALVAHELRDSD